MMQPSDAELLERTSHGDHLAFETFYRRHSEWVMQQAMRRCRDLDEVAELCAAVFIAVWSTGSQFNAEKGTARGWLHGVLSHRFLDLRRKERRHLALRQRVEEEHVDQADDIEAVANRLDSIEAAEPLLRVAKRLPASQLEVVILVMVDGLTPTEAAVHLGLKPSTVRMRLARTRRVLRDQIGSGKAAASPPSPSYAAGVPASLTVNEEEI